MPSMSSPGSAWARATNRLMYSRFWRASSRRRSRSRDRSSSSPVRAWNSVAVGVGHPEELADDQRRNRQREAGHQVGRGAGAGQRVQVVVDDLDDARLQSAHPAHRELGGQHAAQPGVLRRVVGQQVARPVALALLVGAGVLRRPERPRVAEPAAVGQHFAHVGIPGDQVGPRAERGLQFAHALVLADSGQLRDRVEMVASHVQRNRGCLRHRLSSRRTSVRVRRYASRGQRTFSSDLADKYP